MITKRAEEVFLHAVVYSEALPTGSIISSASCRVITLPQCDDVTSQVLSDSTPAINAAGDTVYVPLKATTFGGLFEIIITVTTDNGETLTDTIQLKIENPIFYKA